MCSRKTKNGIRFLERLYELSIEDWLKKIRIKIKSDFINERKWKKLNKILKSWKAECWIGCEDIRKMWLKKNGRNNEKEWMKGRKENVGLSRIWINFSYSRLTLSHGI